MLLYFHFYCSPDGLYNHMLDKHIPRLLQLCLAEDIQDNLQAVTSAQLRFHIQLRTALCSRGIP